MGGLAESVNSTVGSLVNLASPGSFSEPARLEAPRHRGHADGHADSHADSHADGRENSRRRDGSGREGRAKEVGALRAEVERLR